MFRFGLLLLSSALAFVAVSASPIGDIRAVSRIANFNDVAHVFESAYQFDKQCPSKIEIGSAPKVARNIGRVNIGDIKEDGQQCSSTGDGTFKLVSEATVKQGDLLRQLGFPKAFAGIQANRAALATVENQKTDSSLLVGFDEGKRTCGTSTYSDKTFWFFIKEPQQFRIVVRTGNKSALTNITLSQNTRALFVTDGGKKLCLLYDKSTADKVIITRQDDNGVPIVPGAPPKPNQNTTVAVPKPGGAAPPSKPTPPTQPANNNTEVTAPPVTGTEEVILPSPEAPAAAVASPAAAEPTNNGSVCFPANAHVELEGGALVPISSLRIGDRVRSGSKTFSDVFMFSHRDESVRSVFVKLITEARAQITLTKSHYVYANDKLVAAGAVKLGDELVLADGSKSVVREIESVVSKGLYNPHTLDGNLVVDGIITSTYTTSVHPVVAHAGLLAPIRWYYSRIGTSGIGMLASAIGKYADALSSMVPNGPASCMA